jgi:hypothetical protein
MNNMPNVNVVDDRKTLVSCMILYSFHSARIRNTYDLAKEPGRLMRERSKASVGSPAVIGFLL